MNRVDVTVDRDGSGLRVGVVAAAWNQSITDPLTTGAVQRLEALGVSQTTVVRVPGSWELPVVARALATHHDAVVAIGVVIEGETDHYVHIATQATAGLAAVALETGVPVANAVLTVRDAAHAVARSRPGPDNKGAEAAEAAVMAANALRAVR